MYLENYYWDSFKRKKNPPWTLFDLIAVLGFVFVVTNIFSWLIGNFLNTLISTQKVFISTMLQTGTIILAITYLLIFRRAGLRDVGIKRGKSVIKVGLVGGFLIFGSVLITGVIMELLLPVTPELQPFAKIVLETENKGELLLLLFVASFLAPLGEELYFRGLVYPVFKKIWGFKLGLLFTGAFFALLHFDLIRFIPLTIGGAGLAYLYEKTGSIFAPMIAHGAWNGIMLFFLYITDYSL